MAYRLKLFGTVTIDNVVFRLYTQYTFVALLALSVVVLAHSYFVDPIDCVSGDNVPWSVLDSVCYVQGTFSVASAWDKQVGVQVPYPGIENYSPTETRIYHRLYRWVGWSLLVQALVFFMPGYLWRCCERGTVKTIIKKLDTGQPAVNDAINFLCVTQHRRNLALMVAFVCCELLNVIMLIVQLMFVNQMLNNQYIVYGWLQLFSSVTPDIQTRLFPDQAKCSLLRFTSSGDIQRSDATCVLSSNFLYAQIYLILWLWWQLLLVAGVFDVLFRVLTLVHHKARLLSTELPLLQQPHDELAKVVDKLPAASWFLLHLLSKNLDHDKFGQLVKYIAANVNKDGYFGDNRNGHGA